MSDCKKKSLLVDGRIPVGMECPFASECPIKAHGDCKHKGKDHTVPFSCASARGFNLMKGMES